MAFYSINKSYNYQLIEPLWSSIGFPFGINRDLWVIGFGLRVLRKPKPVKPTVLARQHGKTKQGYGTTELGYGTTNTDAGVGINMKRGIPKFD